VLTDYSHKYAVLQCLPTNDVVYLFKHGFMHRCLFRFSIHQHFSKYSG